MKLGSLYAIAAALALAIPAAAQTPSNNLEMPALTSEQSAQVQQQIAGERSTMEARVARGEVTPDEAERYLAWREWQIARQVAGLAPPPSSPPQTAPRPYAYGYPAPAYPYPAPAPYPYYYGPRYWGPVVCAGGWGWHGGARVCF